MLLAARLFCVVCLSVTVSAQGTRAVDLLLTGARVLDGMGNPWVRQDIGVTGDTIVFVGNATAAGVNGG